MLCGEKCQSISDDQLLELQTTVVHHLLILLYSLSLVPPCDLCTLLLLFQSPHSWQRGGHFAGQAWKEARRDYFEILLSPHAQQILSLQPWGMLPCFWKAEEREEATWAGNLCPISLPALEIFAVQTQTLEIFAVHCYLYMREEKRGSEEHFYPNMSAHILFRLKSDCKL